MIFSGKEAVSVYVITSIAVTLNSYRKQVDQYGSVQFIIGAKPKACMDYARRLGFSGGARDYGKASAWLKNLAHSEAAALPEGAIKA